MFSILYNKIRATLAYDTDEIEYYLNDILSNDSGRVLLLVLLEISDSGGNGLERLSAIEDVATTERVGITKPSTNDVAIVVLVEDIDNIVTLRFTMFDNGVARRTHSHSHFSTHTLGNSANLNVVEFSHILCVLNVVPNIGYAVAYIRFCTGACTSRYPQS